MQSLCKTLGTAEISICSLYRFVYSEGSFEIKGFERVASLLNNELLFFEGILS